MASEKLNNVQTILLRVWHIHGETWPWIEAMTLVDTMKNNPEFMYERYTPLMLDDLPILRTSIEELQMTNLDVCIRRLKEIVALQSLEKLSTQSF